jgi:hypothetical protein
MSIEMAIMESQAISAQVERKASKPRIFLRTFGIWYCAGPTGKFGMGYTPAGAYAAWLRNTTNELRNPE